MEKSKFDSQVIYREKLPFFKFDPENHFLIYDTNLEKNAPEESKLVDFIESFDKRYGVRGGEPLKSFKDFPKHLDAIMKMWPEPISRQHTIVALGGGSVGDFTGFLASIIKRGVKLIHIPSTWLSALDSAHGGKTALNYKGAKNQLGTFYPAEKVFIVKNLLADLPEKISEQAVGELIKMSLIGESKFFKEMIGSEKQGVELMWEFLKPGVDNKYTVILKDPYENKDIRQVLNFGHTVGHIFESYFDWSHGDSVLQGIFFALEWSRYRDILSQKVFEQIAQGIMEKFDKSPAHRLKWYRPVAQKHFEKLLKADKKIDIDGNLQFVFLKTIGKPILRPVLISDLLSELKRQGWTK